MTDDDRSTLIEQKLADYHASLAADSASRASRLGPSKPSYGSVPAIAGLVAFVVLFWSFGYLILHLVSHQTTMMTHRGAGSVDSAFKISMIVWAGLSVGMMFNPGVAFWQKLRLVLCLGVGGLPSLAFAIQDYNEQAAETQIFSNGGVESTRVYPIVGTRVHRGRGVSYHAMIDPHNHGHQQDLYISEADFNRIGTVAPHDIYSPTAPDAKFCVTLQIQTSGNNERILWSSFDALPSGWIAPCTPTQTAQIQHAYHEAHLVHRTPEECRKLKQEAADNYNAIERERAEHPDAPQSQTGFFSGPAKHFTPADVGPIYGGYGYTHEVICP